MCVRACACVLCVVLCCVVLRWVAFCFLLFAFCAIAIIIAASLCAFATLDTFYLDQAGWTDLAILDDRWI